MQPTGIVLAECCTNTQSNSFIHFVKKCTVSSCIVSISNQCASSQFLWWIMQPCFVLKSRSQKKQKNFSSFPFSSRSSSIILSILGLLAVGWCSALLANSNNCIFTIFIQSEISNVIPNALLATIQSQSCFNNAKILQTRFASVTPIGPLEKMQSYSTCSTSSFSRSHLCWKSSWATSVPFVSCKEREQKRVKMYHF